MWHWAAKVSARWRWTRRSIRARPVWRQSWRRRRGGRSTPRTNGCRRLRSDASKEALGFRRFSLRGLQKVQGEWNLVCLALSIKRMRSIQAA
ncbi:MAG: transposase [Candidatus Tectomicrobia bacterium]|nr:transposase [Candidatus Tectomicrobia bacterium]